MKNKIIFLNGPSSAGKTSLVKAIQHLSEDFWLTFGIDSALEAMPDKYFGSGEKASQGFHFLSSIDKEGFPITEVKTGPYGEKVDEVNWEEKDLANYVSVLKNYQAYFVKVSCDLAIMEEREILRGDRTWGLARAQNTKMESLKWNYDLQIDTTNTNSFTNAKKILQFLKEN